MNVFKPYLLIACCALLLGSCTKSEPLYQEQIFALGALVDISIWGAKPALARQAAAALTEDFNRVHTTWHAWQPSALTRINEQLARPAAFPVAPELIPLLISARELSHASNGLFNPGIGRLLALWGFQSDERPNGPPPAAKAVAALTAQHPSMDDLHIEGNTLRSTNPALQLDMGAIGQGYAVDIAIEHLRRLGIQNAIVNASGDIRVIGNRGVRPWRIGIRDPQGPGIIASIEMQGDESIVTSGDYERYFEYQGKRYAHILDPRSGYPATGARSITVLHGNATVADAASTALMVAGETEWRQVARAMGIQQVMRIDHDGGVQITPVLAKRLRFEINPVPRVEIVAPL
ncbi:MAG: FAD:protein FMN transferase [Gammaproteobacteria bacterium]